MKEQVDSLDAKIDKKFKQHEYNDMLVRNQSWKYPALVHTVAESRSFEYWTENLGFNDDEAEYLIDTGDMLREAAEKMRQGEFPSQPSDSRGRGVNLTFPNTEVIFRDEVDKNLLPHWKEFTSALKQFTPAFGVLPDGCVSFFRLENLQLENDAMMLMKDALMNKPFHSLAFVNTCNTEGEGHDYGMSVDAIVSIIDSNKQLRTLEVQNNRIFGDGIRNICSSVHNHSSLINLDLTNSCDDHGDEMLISLLTSGHLKLENLNMSYSGITSFHSNVATVLSDFLATDPPLEELELQGNYLNDNAAVLIAGSLRSNKSLRMLNLSGNSITDVSTEAFKLVLHDDSTLNTVSDSNHSCFVHLDVSGSWNVNDLGRERERNRGRKIYRLLTSRHKSTSNVQHFGDIDAKILPNIVRAVQKYASFQSPSDYFYNYVRDLSIVYEIMRKWDKVFPLYCDPK
jgi:hypothetical protein